MQFLSFPQSIALLSTSKNTLIEQKNLELLLESKKLNQFNL